MFDMGSAMSWDLAIRILSPLLTAASIIFAVYTYKRASLVDRMRQLRTYLGEVPRKLQSLDALMSEKCFNQVGLRIADQVFRIVGPGSSVEQVAAFVEEKPNRDYFVQALQEGFYNSGPVRDLDVLVSDIDAVDLRMRSLLPSCSYLLRSVLFFIRRAVESCYSPSQTVRLYDETEFRKNLAEELRKSPSVSVAHAELANYLSAIPGIYVKHSGQKVVDHAKAIADLIIGKITSFTDEELFRFSRDDHRLPLNTKKIEAEVNALNDLVYLAELTRPLFSQVEYDVVFENVTRLRAVLGS
jgi:hypothetical protein